MESFLVCSGAFFHHRGGSSLHWLLVYCGNDLIIVTKNVTFSHLFLLVNGVLTPAHHLKPRAERLFFSVYSDKTSYTSSSWLIKLTNKKASRRKLLYFGLRGCILLSGLIITDGAIILDNQLWERVWAVGSTQTMCKVNWTKTDILWMYNLWILLLSRYAQPTGTNWENA